MKQGWLNSPAAVLASMQTFYSNSYKAASQQYRQP